MTEPMFDADRAFEIIAEIEDQLAELRDAVRGADSASVAVKLNTLEVGLGLLRAYVEEAADE